MLRGRPVALLPSAFEAIDAQLGAAIAARLGAPGLILVPGSAAGLVASPAAGAAGGGDATHAVPAPLYDFPAPGVARVVLRGVCGRHLGELAMACGGCDVDCVADAVRKAGEDPAVRAIVLDCDSPGGSVAGVADCARAVRSSEKPVVALASDLCASAAYWIASQADALVVGITGEVGSVGVYCAILDKSRAYDAKGLRVDVIASGANKGAGTPGTSLTDEQREVLQAQILEVADIFKAAVRAARPDCDENILDGRVLVGASAVKAGLADQTGEIEAAIGLALQLADAAEEANRNTKP
jgi:signal peptide peptidase SppA